MPRRLPPVPSLPHLKKQAKRLLRHLQQERPEATLSDAQFTLAKNYGFASWPRLKKHVDSLQPEQLNARLAGTWIADASRSRFAAIGQFRPATVRFVVDGDAVTVTHVSSDVSARESRGTYTMLADGREHPRGISSIAIAKWVDSLTLELVEAKDGVAVNGWQFQLSADVRTLTMTPTGDAIRRGDTAGSPAPSDPAEPRLVLSRKVETFGGHSQQA